MSLFHKRIYIFILTLTCGIFSQQVFAQLNGSFSGAADQTTFQCVIPGPGSVQTLGTHNITFSASTNSVNLSISGPDFSYSGSGTVTEPSTGIFTGNLSGTFSINSTLTGGSDSEIGNNFVATTDSSGNLTSISFGLDGFSGSGSVCDEYIVSIVKATIPSPTSPTSPTSNQQVDPEFIASSTVTEALLFNTQIQTQVTDISRHITGAVGGGRYFWRPRIRDDEFKVEGATGLNAGDGSTIPYGVWGSYSYTDFDNDLSSTAFDGNSHSFLGGLDFAFWENTVLGVAIGYDNGDIDTTFNQGNQDTDSYTIAPYFGALLTDTLSLDFNVGYSRVEYDQFRVAPGTTTQITSSPDADRWFGALNLNGVTYYDNWILGARVGALWAKSVIDSYTESNGTIVAQSRSKVGEASIAGDVAYSYKNFEPFLNLSYQYDFQLTELSVTTGPQPSHDRDDILMRVGVRYFDNNGISGNVEYSKRFDRDDFDEDRISLTLRIDF